MPMKWVGFGEISLWSVKLRTKPSRNGTTRNRNRSPTIGSAISQPARFCPVFTLDLNRTGMPDAFRGVRTFHGERPRVAAGSLFLLGG